MEIREYKFPNKNKMILRYCPNCLKLILDDGIELEKELMRFFEFPKNERIYFCSKACKEAYISNNPIVEKQVRDLQRAMKK